MGYTGTANSGNVLASNGLSGVSPSFQPASGGFSSNTAFLATLNSGTVNITSPTGYFLGSSIALTSQFDNTGGAFFVGTGTGNSRANAATYTVPSTGLYSFTMYANFIGGSNNTVLMSIFPLTAFLGGGYFWWGNIFSALYTSPALSVNGTVVVYAVAGTVIPFFINCGPNPTGTLTLFGGDNLSGISGYRIA